MDVIIFVFGIISYLRGYKAWGIVGLLVISTNLCGFASNSSDFIHEHNMTDLALTLSLIFFVHERVKGKFIVDKNLTKVVYIYFSYLFLAMFIDYTINHTAIYDIIRTGKYWLFLLTAFTFSRLTYGQLKQVFRIIVIITLAQTIVYYVQYFTGIQL